MKRDYNVNILESMGTCDSELFKKMINRGDITSYKIKDKVGDTIEISGYAFAEITTSEKTFKIGYYATNNGFYSTGSEVFLESVKDYIDDCKKFTIMEVRTKRGTTYKASPVLEFTNED